MRENLYQCAKVYLYDADNGMRINHDVIIVINHYVCPEQLC